MKLLALILLAVALCAAQFEGGNGVEKSRGDWSDTDKEAMREKWNGEDMEEMREKSAGKSQEIMRNKWSSRNGMAKAHGQWAGRSV